MGRNAGETVSKSTKTRKRQLSAFAQTFAIHNTEIDHVILHSNGKPTTPGHTAGKNRRALLCSHLWCFRRLDQAKACSGAVSARAGTSGAGRIWNSWTCENRNDRRRVSS